WNGYVRCTVGDIGTETTVFDDHLFPRGRIIAKLGHGWLSLATATTLFGLRIDLFGFSQRDRKQLLFRGQRTRVRALTQIRTETTVLCGDLFTIGGRSQAAR